MSASPDAQALQPFIRIVADGQSLTIKQAAEAFDIIMSGVATPAQIGGFLMALRVRGETIDEITGAANIMRAKAVPVEAPADAMDIVGTGGDATGTYNISTCTALVVAGCGVKIAKHGNRALSSKSGAGDVLAELGVNLDVTPEVVSQAIADAGVGFMFAPAHHAAMRHVGPARVELGTRTIFNLLGPLSNPAGAKRMLLGVFARSWVEPLAHVMKNLGAECVWVVHGSDGLDEITTTGKTYVAALEDGAVRTFEIEPGDAGLKLARPGDLKGGDPATNAAAIRSVLDGSPGAFRDIVLFNAAAALCVAGQSASLHDGVKLAAAAIDNGAAKRALEKLVALTNA